MASLPLIHQLTSGICAWLTLQQMQGSTSNLEESSLYLPLHDIARARGYEVICQCPLPRTSGQIGAPKSFDLLMLSVKYRHILVLEVKFKKPNKRMTGSVGADIAKMMLLSDRKLEALAKRRLGEPQGTGFKVSRAAMIIWRRSDVVDHFRLREHLLVRRQWTSLLKGLSAGSSMSPARAIAQSLSGRPTISSVANRFGSLRAGSTLTAGRFWVATLFQQLNWESFR